MNSTSTHPNGGWFRRRGRAVKQFLRAGWIQLQVAGFVFRVVLPLLLRTRTRPVLVERYVGIGDIICTFPAVHELKRRHPGAAFIYSCCLDYNCLPRMGGITPTTTPLNSRQLKTFWAWLFSATYLFQYGSEHEFAVSSKVLIEEFCRQFGVPIHSEHPPLKIAPEVSARAKEILNRFGFPPGPLIMIHPGPSWKIREWPRESCVAVVEKLRAQGFRNIVQIGVGQLPLTSEIHDIVIPNAHSLVDQSTLEEAVALIAQCNLFVGIDSGLLHIAASLRVPGVGIFGPSSPQLRFSSHGSCSFVVSEVECQGCHHRLPCLHWIKNCPFEIKCMKTIPAETIVRTCLEKLNQQPNPPHEPKTI